MESGVEVEWIGSNKIKLLVPNLFICGVAAEMIYIIVAANCERLTTNNISTLIQQTNFSKQHALLLIRSEATLNSTLHTQNSTMNYILPLLISIAVFRTATCVFASGI